MKKIVIVTVMTLFAVMFSANAGNDIQWYNRGEMYDWLGNLMPEDSGCVIRMYTTVDDTINFGIVDGVATATGDDTYANMEFSLLSGGDVGLGYANMINSTITAGSKIYSVIFSDSPTAGFYAIAAFSPTTLTQYTAESFLYITDKDVQQGDWQAVPEPATFGLMAMGAGIAWLVRLKQRIG
jgi:hypothetical protein